MAGRPAGGGGADPYDATMSRVTVMVVDDHRMVADGLAGVLETDPGLEVIARAASGAEAMTMALESRPDAAVIDLRLPDIGGVELATRLQEVLPGLPVVLISASFTRDALDAALDAGISAFASKLASGDELVQVVRAAIGGTAYISSDVVPMLRGGGRDGDVDRRASARSSRPSPTDVTSGRSPPGCISATTRCATTSVTRCRSWAFVARSTPWSPRAGSATSRSARERRRRAAGHVGRGDGRLRTAV